MDSLVKENICLDSADYLELIGFNRNDVTLEELHQMELDLWDYPITEIEHIVENCIPVVLVRFPEMYGGYDYRFCEVSCE